MRHQTYVHAGVLLLALLLAAAALAQPDTPVELWRYQAIEDLNAFATLPDVDGDGHPDVVIEAYDAGASGDHLALLSGGASGTPGVIWSVRPSSGVSDGGGDGQEYLVTCDDLGGDGFPDVLVSTAWGNRSVHAVDGLTGQVLWTFDSYHEPESGWIYAVRTVPDRTGDGRPEVVFGTGSDGHRGYLLDGADGSIIWRFLGASDAIGYTEALPDMNGDEIADVLFCGWDNEHRVFCVSGAGSVAGAQIWSRDTGSSNYNATVIDDVTGDGIAEVVVGTWQASNQVVCLDGADGSTVWTFHNGSYNYIMRLVTCDDVDGDGYRDLAVGSWSRGLPVISGRTGELIWMSYAGTLNGGDFWTVASVSDLDGDGVGEVAGGSFDGLVYLFAGADGDTLWAFDTGHRLFAVAGAPDLDGNGTDDVLGGTQYLSSGGRAYALQGGDDATAVPELPEAAGHAVRTGPAVALAWNLTSPYPCVVDRLTGDEDGVKAAAASRELALAFATGGLDTREVLAQRRADKAAAASTVRLTPVPLAPEAQANGEWGYAFTDQDAPGADVRYRVAVVLPDGREATVLELAPTGEAVPPPVLRQVQVVPNPFNPTTDLRLSLDRAATVTVGIHDARGHLVGRLGPQAMPAGDGALRWTGVGLDGRDLPAGVYVLRVSAGGQAWTVKAALVR